jgi:HSP20 family molecular chaperone IbpA
MTIFSVYQYKEISNLRNELREQSEGRDGLGDKSDFQALNEPKNEGQSIQIPDATRENDIIYDPFSSPFFTDPRNDIFSSFQQMEERMNRMMQNAFGSSPFGSLGGDVFGNRLFSMKSGIDSNARVDETRDKYIIHLKIPDPKQAKISVECKESAVVIKGEVIKKSVDDCSSHHYSMQSSQIFTQSIPLDKPVRSETMQSRVDGDSYIIEIQKV